MSSAETERPLTMPRLAPQPAASAPQAPASPGADPTRGAWPGAHPGVAPARRALRLVAAPDCEPPYDDERAGALLRREPVRLSPVPPALRLVAAPDDDEETEAPVRTALAALGPARPFALALVQRLVEVVGGARPLAQLQRDTSPSLYARLERQVRSSAAPAGRRPAGGAVRSVHVQTRPEGVAEVCATVRRGPRTVALALRLEGVGGRWCCVELQGL